jgi:Tol biopolymer transport system component
MNRFLKIVLTAMLIAIVAISCNNSSKKMEMVKAKQIPLEDFFKNPEKSRYQISPDGKYFSFLAPYESRMNIFVQERGKDEAERLTSETDRDISGYFWPNSNQILYLKDNGGDENFRLYGVNIDGTNQVNLRR